MKKVLSVHTHLHLFIVKEKEDEEASPFLQGDSWPPDFSLPESTLEGVADNMGLDSVEARVEVEGDIWPRMQAAPTLEVHLKPPCMPRDHTLQHDHLACIQATKNCCDIRNHRVEDRWLQDEAVRDRVQVFVS